MQQAQQPAQQGGLSANQGFQWAQPPTFSPVFFNPSMQFQTMVPFSQAQAMYFQQQQQLSQQAPTTWKSAKTEEASDAVIETSEGKVSKTSSNKSKQSKKDSKHATTEDTMDEDADEIPTKKSHQSKRSKSNASKGGRNAQLDLDAAKILASLGSKSPTASNPVSPSSISSSTSSRKSKSKSSSKASPKPVPGSMKDGVCVGMKDKRAVKESLPSTKIRKVSQTSSRRSSANSRTSSVSSPPPTTSLNLMSAYELKRQRNNEAVRRCRVKKKMELEEKDKRLKEYEKKLIALTAEVDMLNQRLRVCAKCPNCISPGDDYSSSSSPASSVKGDSE